MAIVVERGTRRWWGALAVVIIAAAGCGFGANRTPPEPGPLSGPGHLVYFGFAGIDCGLDDPNDTLTKTSYVDEVSGFTNVGQLCVFEPSQVVTTQLKTFRQAGLRALLHIETVLFDRIPDPAKAGQVKLTLAKDAQTRWDTFQRANAGALDADHVAFLYLADEPTLNGLSTADLSAAATIVKAAVPNIDTMIVEGYPALDRLRVPSTIDWFGWDHYAIADPATDKTWHQELDRLRSLKSRPDQRLVVVADTQWLDAYEPLGWRKDDMDAVMRSYYRGAAADPDVGALLGYIWPGGLDGSGQLGARDLPATVQATFRAIGTMVLANGSGPTSTGR